MKDTERVRRRNKDINKRKSREGKEEKEGKQVRQRLTVF